MANKRTYWAIEAIGTAAHGAGNTAAGATPDLAYFYFVPGVQSVGMSTNFNLDQIFQLGQLEIYQDLEDIPDIELSVEKVFDDTALMYTRCVSAADGTAANAYTATWAGAKELTTIQNNRVDVAFVVNDDADKAIGDNNGTVAAHMSGMFLSSVNFNFGADGYFTESVTLVGNHQKWFTPAATMANSPADPGALQSGDVSRRHNFSFKDIGDVPVPVKTIGGDVNDLRIASISVATDLGREEMFSLGTREPYHRYVTFPIEVTCDIEAYVTDAADFAVNALPNATNVTSTNHIKFHVYDGTSGGIISNPGPSNHYFDLGENNTLQSMTWNGLSTDGTNATVTYSYRNFNRLNITSTANVVQP